MILYFLFLSSFFFPVLWSDLGRGQVVSDVEGLLIVVDGWPVMDFNRRLAISLGKLSSLRALIDGEGAVTHQVDGITSDLIIPLVSDSALEIAVFAF